jgi:hypothetical protein
MVGKPGETKVIHNFKNSLEFSHSASDLPIWETIYKKAFPSMVEMIDHRQHGEHQYAGIDRSIVLENSKQILIDEKVRGKNKITGRVYKDIALEYISNDQKESPGWVCKPIRADYIAYVIIPIRTCYLLPVIQLQNAWAENKTEWLANYHTIKADNGYYKTLSLCLPVDTLFKAIGQQLRIIY